MGVSAGVASIDRVDTHRHGGTIAISLALNNIESTYFGSFFDVALRGYMLCPRGHSRMGMSRRIVKLEYNLCFTGSSSYR
jgi:hypothetical protein